jgi:hypothetical protein
LKKVPHFRKRERLDQQRGILPKINQIKTPS